jgi:hypothetical protein
MKRDTQQARLSMASSVKMEYGNIHIEEGEKQKVSAVVLRDLTEL